MALRLGLIALRAADAAELEDVFPELTGDQQVGAPPCAANGWAWALLSLWTHGHLCGAAAEQRLRSRDSLQIWTEDDARWLMAIYRPGRKPLRFVQVFHLLELARDPSRFTEEEAAESVEQLVRYWEENLPEGYRETGPWPPGPVDQALPALLRHRAEGVSGALREASVVVDGGEIEGILTGTGLEDDELESGVGNLPRFLEAIGLGNVFPRWREDLEETRRERREEEAATAETDGQEPAPDRAGPILAALDGREPEPIEGGRIALSATEIGRLWKLPWCCDNSVEIAFLVRPPGGTAISWPEIEHLTVVDSGGELRVGHPWASVWTRERVYAELARSLAMLPAGTEVEMVSARPAGEGGDERPTTAGNHRFRGVIQSGLWIVTHALPRATAAEIRQALALFAESVGTDAFAARDEAEAAAIVERAVRSGHFLHQADRPRADGLSVVVKEEYRPYLTMIILRERLKAGPWDLESGQAADQSGAIEWEQMAVDLTTTLTQAFASQREQEAELVFQGPRSGFRKADIHAVQSHGFAALVGQLFPGRTSQEPPSPAEAVAAVDRGMAGARLNPLGDMACEAFGDVVIRGYGKKAGSLYGVLMAGTTGAFVYELITAFTDGTTLVTSINAGTDAPAQRSLHVHLAGASVEALLKRHAQGVFQLLAEGRQPKAHPPELAGLAAELDAFLARRSGS